MAAERWAGTHLRRREDHGHEQDRLDALADDGHEGERRRAPRPSRFARARSTPCSSSPFIARPWRRIQKSIQVRTATASSAATPSIDLLDDERQAARSWPRR